MGYDAHVIVVFGIRISKVEARVILEKLFPDMDSVLTKEDQDDLELYSQREKIFDLYEAWIYWDSDIELAPGYRMVSYENVLVDSGTYITFSTVEIQVVRGPDILSKEFSIPPSEKFKACEEFLAKHKIQHNGVTQYLVIRGG